MTEVKKNNSILLVSVVIVVSILALLISYNSQKKEISSSKDYYSIADESAGIAFNISKNFTAISREELVRLNPSYLYGFHDNKNSSVACFISQTTITKQGKITALYLKNGVFESVKVNYPSAKLNNWSPVKRKPAVFLDISYEDQGKKIDQPELVLVDTKNTTFGFCQVPSANKAQFQDDFTIFFSSLNVL